jgi:Ca2+-binding RTX toxin-like protein
MPIVIVEREGRIIIGTDAIGTGTDGSDRILEAGDIEWDEVNSRWITYSSDDFIDGLSGNDFIWGNYGNDTIIGDLGDDYFDGGMGNDIVRGGAGNDRLLANGNATLEGGTGNDLYEYMIDGNKVIDDASGDDTVGVNVFRYLSGIFRNGNDLTLTQVTGLSLVIKNYFVTGENGGHVENIAFMDGPVWHMADVLAVLQQSSETTTPPQDTPPQSTDSNGSQTNIPEEPEIAGPCPPARTIVAGKVGKELFTGNTAADVFQFASAKMAGLRKSADVILNFEHGVDTIDLSGIDANTKAAGNNAFNALLTGRKPFTKAGQLHYDSKTGVLSGNTDKDAAAEFQIQLKNKPNMLDLSDFVL